MNECLSCSSLADTFLHSSMTTSSDQCWDSELMPVFKEAEAFLRKGNLGAFQQLMKENSQVSSHLNLLTEYMVRSQDAVVVFNLATCFSTGNRVIKDLKRAFELYSRASDMGYPLAVFSLGCCYENGKGTIRDVKKAIELFQRATIAAPFWTQFATPSMQHLKHLKTA